MQINLHFWYQFTVSLDAVIKNLNAITYNFKKMCDTFLISNLTKLKKINTIFVSCKEGEYFWVDDFKVHRIVSI